VKDFSLAFVRLFVQFPPFFFKPPADSLAALLNDSRVRVHSPQHKQDVPPVKGLGRVLGSLITEFCSRSELFFFTSAKAGISSLDSF